MAEFVGARPFRETNLRDEFRLDPMTLAHLRSGETGAVAIAFFLWQIHERTIGDANFFQLTIERAQRGLVKTRSDLAREKKFLFFKIADEQRAEKFSRTLRIGETADHEFLFERDLQLDPRAGAQPRFIKRIFAFADQTFQPKFARLFEQILNVSFERSGKTHAIRRIGEKFFEGGFARG